MDIEHCNLCGESLSKPGSGGTTVGVSLETNQLTVSHTRCRDMYIEQAKSMQADADVHSKPAEPDPIEEWEAWERDVLAADGFDC